MVIQVPYLLTIFFLLSWSALGFTAEFTASVDRTQISKNDTLELTLKLNERAGYDSPNLTALEQDFEVLGTNRSNQMTMINGVTESTTQWTVMLFPKSEGTLTIPPLHYENLSTQPINITVSNSSNVSNTNDQPIFFSTTVDSNSVYVQSQLILTIKLFYNINLDSGTISDLKIDDAVVESLGDATNYETLIKGVRYRVNESKFAIFPQRSGELTIPTITFQGISQGRGLWSRGKRLGARSEPIDITVKPKPSSYPANQPWLPAKNLELTDTWSTDQRQAKTGEPITRKISIQAEGLSVAQLPPLPVLDYPGMKTYPDQPQTENKTNPNGITAIRTESTAIIPTRQGELNIPATEIYWWNTTTDQLETSRLDETEIRVASASNQPNIDSTPVAPNTILPPKASENPASDTLISSPDVRYVESPMWKILAFILILSNMGLAVWIFFLRRSLKASSTSHSNLSNALSMPIDNTHQIFKKVIQSASDQDLSQTRQEVIQWAQKKWDNHEFHNLNDVIQHIHHQDLQHQLKSLDRTLYSNNSPNWDHKAFIAAFTQAHKQKNKSSTEKKYKPTVLRPLYPS